MSVQVWLRGGLGNQLFQYSFGLEFAKRFGTNLVLRSDLLPAATDSFKGLSRWPEQISTFNHSGQILAKSHQPTSSTSAQSKVFTMLTSLAMRSPKSGLAAGFVNDANYNLALDYDYARRQSGLPINAYGYFLNSAIPLLNQDQILGELLEIRSPTESFKRALVEVEGMKALHLRLGDHLNLDNRLTRKIQLELEQTLVLDSELKSGNVALFSDSMGPALEVLDSVGIAPKVMVQSNLLSPIELLRVIGSCRGIFASASTFSWWAAFLQGGEHEARFVVKEKFANWRLLSLPHWT